MSREPIKQEIFSIFLMMRLLIKLQESFQPVSFVIDALIYACNITKKGYHFVHMFVCICTSMFKVYDAAFTIIKKQNKNIILHSSHAF